ncbi:MAG: hypothetical protein ACJAZW_002313 [Maritalea sp.]
MVDGHEAKFLTYTISARLKTYPNPKEIERDFLLLPCGLLLCVQRFGWQSTSANDRPLLGKIAHGFLAQRKAEYRIAITSLLA